MPTTAQDEKKTEMMNFAQLGGGVLMHEDAAAGPPANAHDLLSRLQPRPWDSAASVAFEAAQEAIGHAIGCYSSLLDVEERSADPRSDQIRAWSAARQASAEERKSLRAYDQLAVARARERYAELVPQLEAELRELRR
ncbi:MAG: hypothetical protein ABT15_31675 [Pseudonocardia sp. SCN 73-27]|mgnify:CR=1 FL=1|uniref:hypothetical protein n=1 Tax=Pseudonocardia sp. SCN 73-27 TaxID=1660132 RepID=UPI00086C991A|nr:hypothetical protein [Pseudonocardia sp. SCN 73-27]ODU99481.1 MAG: hypothetical protein ABT15_31675 [Pseudonocardia sp. SCN 73-27]